MPKAAGPHAAISSDGRKLAIGYRDESDQRLFRVQLYDLATKTKLGEPFAVAAHDFRQLEFSADGKKLLISDRLYLNQPFRSQLIDVSSEAPKQVKTAAAGAVVALSPSGTTLLCRRSNGRFGLFRSDGSQPTALIGDWLVLRAQPAGFWFSGDGNILVTQLSDGSVESFDATTAERFGPAIQFPEGGSHLAIDRTGTLLAVVSGQGDLQFCDLATGYRIGPTCSVPAPVIRKTPPELSAFDARLTPSALTFASDDQEVVAYYSVDRTFRRWPVPHAVVASSQTLRDEIAALTGSALSEEGSLAVLDSKAWQGLCNAIANEPAASLAKLFDTSPRRIPAWQSEQVWQDKVRAPDLSGIQPLHEDEFDDPASGFHVLENAEYKSASFYRDGRFVIRSDQKNRCVRSGPWKVQDFACRVRCRSVGSEQSYWELHLTPGVSGQFLQVRMIADGSVQVRLSNSSNERLTVGPLFHPAIKRDDEFNEMLVILRENVLRIYVNGIGVADPIRPSFSIPAGRIMLTGGTDSSAQAEFERIEVWEADKIAPPGSP
jgi:hypothetical protein